MNKSPTWPARRPELPARRRDRAQASFSSQSLQEGDCAQVRWRADTGVGKLEIVGFRFGDGDDRTDRLAGSVFAPTNDNGARALSTIGRKSLIGS